jgi:transcriptional regulator with XRE-family HTH domain
MKVDPYAEPAVRLAQQLRLLREKAGISPKEMGKRLRMHREGVDRLERNGDGGELPSVRTILRFAEALSVEPSEILCVLDERWAMAERWRQERIASGAMAECATPIGGAS